MGANGINNSAKIRYAKRKYAVGRLPSVSRSGDPMQIIEFAKLSVSDFAEKSSVWNQNLVSSPL